MGRTRSATWRTSIGRAAHSRNPSMHLPDRHGLARRGVVGPAGLAPGQQEPVRAHHVADVGEIAPRRGGADLEDRRPAPPLDLGDLPGDVAPDEAEPLPGADVVEGADDHQRQPLGAGVVPRVELLGGLRQGVGRPRGPAPVFGDRLLGLGDHPVDLARGDHEAGNRMPAQALAELIRGLEVRPEDVRAQRPRGADHRGAGQVEHAVRAGGPQHLARGAGLRQVAGDGGHVLLHRRQVVGRRARQDRAHHLRALPQGQLREMASGEAGDAGDQDLHGTARPRRAFASARGGP